MQKHFTVLFACVPSSLFSLSYLAIVIIANAEKVK